MKWKNEIDHAIEEHKKLEIVYDGVIREVAPHILGRSSTGQLILSTFQFHHSLDPFKNNQWRSFIVEKIDSLRILDETFYPRFDYNPFDRTFLDVMSQI